MKMRNFNILFAVIFTWLLCADNSFAIWPFGRKKAEEKPVEIMPLEKPPVEERKSASVQFREAKDLLKNADEARDEKRFTDALSLYESTLTYYKKLARSYPDHEAGVTRFRIIYCSNQLKELQGKTDSSANSAASSSGKTDAQTMMERETREIMNPSPVSDNDVKDIIDAAKILLEQDQAEKAYQALKKGLRTNPDNQDVRFLIGIVLCHKAKYENAMYLLESLIEEDPSNAYIHIALGTAYYGSGLNAKAIMEMKYALNLNPELHEAHFNLAQIIITQDPSDKNTAISHYKNALKYGGKRNRDLEKLLK